MGFYSAQSSPPFIHSKTSPTNKIITKSRVRRVGVRGLNENNDAGRGKSRAISRSKRRNSMATRKNRKEKGIRADFKGSKPHS